MTDDSRQDGAGAHIAAGEPDAREQECRACLGCAQSKIRRHGEDGAGAGANPVCRRYYGLRTGAHGFDEVAGHARESAQSRAVKPRQRADDFVHVAARAEVAAGAADDDRANFLHRHQCAEEITQLSIGLEGERILALRAIQRDEADTFLVAPLEMPGLESRRIESRSLTHDRSVSPLGTQTDALNSPSSSTSCFFCRWLMGANRSMIHCSCSAAMRRN